MEELALRIVTATPPTIRRLTADLSTDETHLRPAVGEWSIVEIIGHLIDKTEVWGERLRRIAAEADPQLPAFDQDEYVRERDYQAQDAEPLVDRLSEMQMSLVGELRALPADAWQRTGVHGERGRLSLGEACRIYAISLPDHVDQVVQTRRLVSGPDATVR